MPEPSLRVAAGVYASLRATSRSKEKDRKKTESGQGQPEARESRYLLRTAQG